MLDGPTLLKIDAYWARYFGCDPDQVFTSPLTVVTHGSELSGYRGVYALFRNGAAIASLPPESASTLRPLLQSLSESCLPTDLSSALAGVTERVLGPAYLGYAMELSLPGQLAQTLKPEDGAALHRLQEACGTTDWESGGSKIENPCSGVFVTGQLAAVAGYEIWGDHLAHISIVTDPRFRGRGFGRAAVAHLAERAIQGGLIPQYRTLEANQPSIRIADSLGFQRYAISMAIRLRPDE